MTRANTATYVESLELKDYAERPSEENKHEQVSPGSNLPLPRIQLTFPIMQDEKRA